MLSFSKLNCKFICIHACWVNASQLRTAFFQLLTVFVHPAFVSIRSSASHTINRFLVPSQGSPSNSGNQFVALLSSKKETKKRISFSHACGWVGLLKLDSSLVCWTIQVFLISDQILDCMVSGQDPRLHLADVM